MTGRLHEITARRKDFWAGVSKIDDFTLGPARDVSPDKILTSPDWSLYCLDFTQGKALFVELPAGTNLAETPFVYVAQFEHALRAITVPMDLVEDLGGKLASPPQLAFLFSTGRCGSTLASRILAQLPGVWSLSEPDCYTNLALGRFSLEPARARTLIAAATRLLCRPPRGVQVDTIVIKPRSEAIMQAENLGQAVPGARNIFMYRDAESYVNSVYKFEQRVLGEEQFFSSTESWRTVWPIISINSPLTLLDEYFGMERGEIARPEILTMAWDIRIEAYLAALRNGGNFHYSDLNTNREAEATRLLAGCGIPTTRLDLAMQGFQHDAHSGSGSANDIPAKSLDAAQRATIHVMLKRLGKTDYRTTRLPDSATGSGVDGELRQLL